ncbi:aldo/keto reductase, partial [Streptomyces lunaelactis]|uniref:aldo/keto reductase n=1 Tax=Streptomyces lunaelactis TaxID=1535768 RepID=UPI001585AF6B
MQWRALGRSAVEITELSFGAAGIGNLFTPVDPAVAAAAIDATWDAGIRTFDTPPHYGLGLSERRLGEALRTRESLVRLGLDRIDIVYLHDPDDHEEAAFR